ncbi:DUF1963 domain-containing protein [Paenibacillus donghaensis]|uniref:DUF1963 domain-containing protein n=1 Tax=Paenibacillus donghaensis TaxID=414771 RepID=A0A2Z2K435_9BACL|nr:DUF1963 domain-containing protein [Paenibacillus donghaensis]ASA20416.1 DUF1963 domain-containing protein [Paenibacillus donghaensis]
MTERIECQTPGCSATILPATAAKTGGYCMPCHQEQQREEQRIFIEQNRKEVDLYEEITDPVEVLRIMHTSRRYDPLIEYVPYPLNREQLYTALSLEEAERMQAYALELLEAGDEDTATEILASLVCYSGKLLDNCWLELMEQNVYNPAILFKDAPPSIRNLLLEKVEIHSGNRNPLLLALAWIGDEAVVQQFLEWRRAAPEWAQELYVTPERYAQEAGWELTAAGERRDLFARKNYAMERMDAPLEAGDQASEAFVTVSHQQCPWCGGQLTTLVELQKGHPALKEIAWDGERLAVDTCVICGSYSVIYMEVDPAGTPFWSKHNQRPDYLPDINLDDYGQDYLAAGPLLSTAESPRNTYHSAVWGIDPIVSQIGGHPSWVQDAEYPVCPCCSHTMSFIAQLDWGQLEEYGEGIYYMFSCAKDRITATLYQQS